MIPTMKLREIVREASPWHGPLRMFAGRHNSRYVLRVLQQWWHSETGEPTGGEWRDVPIEEEEQSRLITREDAA